MTGEPEREWNRDDALAAGAVGRTLSPPETARGATCDWDLRPDVYERARA